MLLAQNDDFLGDTVDAVGVTGVGVVSKVTTKVEECCQTMKKAGAPDDLLTTVVTVKHSEYHPSVSAPFFLSFFAFFHSFFSFNRNWLMSNSSLT